MAALDMGGNVLRIMANSAALVLWGTAALLVGAVFLVLYRRPKWARLEHDARVWRFAWVRTKRWAKDHLRTEAVLIIGASIWGATAINDAENLARAISGVFTGLAAVVGGASMLLVYHLAVAPADLHTEQLKKRELLYAQVIAAKKTLKTPTATLMFDGDDVRCVQRGETRELVDGRSLGGRQTLYALGVVNHSAHRVDGCRVVLHAVLGHHTTQHRLERPMRVRADTVPSGVFDLSALGGKPSRFVEVLEAWEPPSHIGVKSRLRMTYAGSENAKPVELEHGDHIIAFRLETDTALSVCYLQARYSEPDNRWSITQISARPIRHTTDMSRSRDFAATRSTMVET